MKRGAERQISKDDDDEIEEVDDPGKGFQKADESVLTKRQIRGLPKRAMASNKASSFAGLSNAPSSPADSPEPQKFGAFSGFGSGASSPFSFTPSAPSPTSNVAFSASAATKSFASVVQSASIANASPPSASDDDYEAALKYYKSVRGLNVSFLSAIQRAVDQDPFVDIAGLLEGYKNLRTTVQTDLDSSSKPPNQKPSASGSSSSALPAPENAAPPTSGFPAPKGFSGFAGFGSTPSTNSNTNTEKSSAPQSTFSFPTSSSSTVSVPTFNTGAKPSEEPAPTTALRTSEAPKSAFSFGTKSDDPGSSKSTAFSFATPPAPATNKGKDDSATSSSSAFGSSSAIPNFFTPSAFSESSSKPTSTFGATTSLFGTNTDSSKPSLFTPGSSDLFNKVSMKSDTVKEEPKTENTTSLFGGSSFTPTSSAFGPTTTTDKPTSAFGTFGGGSPPKGNGFTFGKVGGSIGNPVGFGFGVAKPADDVPEPSSSASAGFSFGAPPPKSVSPPMEAIRRSESQPAGGDEGVQDDAKLLPTGNHDGEGEGEENEETTYTVRAKLFKLTKTSDKSEWKDLGVGMFRLKKHKETGARRALMRNSATGRIIINFRLFPSLSPTLMKTMVSFVGHDNGTPASFRIRVKTPEQAQELNNALDREVAAVKESN
ncbi:hypothetical protein AZE42_06437 [Rhizopogon vesiculosus]|uniref:RanBD1 domain-containing protein n=1 Tax=Rhizopogon vesiculosus TaxID=180088 RepID=A0A1J8QCH3_9AGAM|nr:hypothetical protein AZE42_06437 [Rhizopogon vesiculosus]